MESIQSNPAKFRVGWPLSQPYLRTVRAELNHFPFPVTHCGLPSSPVNYISPAQPISLPYKSKSQISNLKSPTTSNISSALILETSLHTIVWTSGFQLCSLETTLYSYTYSTDPSVRKETHLEYVTSLTSRRGRRGLHWSSRSKPTNTTTTSFRGLSFLSPVLMWLWECRKGADRFEELNHDTASCRLRPYSEPPYDNLLRTQSTLASS
ncbi:hypothetical protein GGS26DRAFT_523841 [Hypomontagnella submonticulosa]|nr:hypothetical protein GGS26DRAFT_523841 [Hypomontagnella submonticulosa]